MRLLIVIVLCVLCALSAAAYALTPVVTGAGAATLVLKAGPGQLYYVSASNLTATPGFLVVLNLTAAPVDGAVTPLLCVPLPASSTAVIDLSATRASFSVGITAVVSSGATCFTKTTGVITAFIAGLVE